jgi:non-homologous end joining protein Ku
MKMLRRGLKTLDELDEAKAYKKAKAERVIIEEATIESKPIPLDSDLATTIESFNPLDPF